VEFKFSFSSNMDTEVSEHVEINIIKTRDRGSESSRLSFELT